MPAVSMTVNGKAVTADVDPRTLLVQFLRENLRLTGTHVGCDTSQCGACVVHVDGKAVKSCTMLALQADGADGDAPSRASPTDGKLHPMQEAFRENHGLQCGFCTPGMIMTAVDIVNRKGNELDEKTIRQELEGNICRCTGYHNIVKAIAAGAKAMAGVPRKAADRAAEAIKLEEETAMSCDRDRRGGAPQGRPPLHHRQGPVHRRHQPAGPDLRVFRALAACARQDQADRHRARPRRCRACSRC